MKKNINSADCFVAYLDMLGYRQLVRTSDKASFLFAAVDSALNRWKESVDTNIYFRPEHFRNCLYIGVFLRICG